MLSITYEYEFFFVFFVQVIMVSVLPFLALWWILKDDEYESLFFLISFNTIISIALFNSLTKTYKFDASDYQMITEIMKEEPNVSFLSRDSDSPFMFDSNIIYKEGNEYTIHKDFTHKFNYEK